MGVPVYVDDLSHLNNAQRLKINSILNAEYKRFQRKSYQKKNTSEPLVTSSDVKSIDTRVHSLSTRTYNGLTTASFIINTYNMEQNKGYRILETTSSNISLSYTVLDSKETVSSINEAMVYSSGNNIIFAPVTDNIKSQYYVYLFWKD